MKNLFLFKSIIIVAMLFFACLQPANNKNTTLAPVFNKTKTTTLKEKNTTTNIALPININVTEIEKLFEKEVPIGKVLFDGKNIDINNFAKADVKVTSLEHLKVYTQFNKIAVKLNAKINVKAKATKLFKNLKKSDEIKATAIGYLTPNFDENWKFTPELDLKLDSYDAIEIKIAGIKIKLDDFVVKELEHQLNNAVKPGLLKLLKRNINIRNDVLKLWNSIDPIYKIASKPVSSNLVIEQPIKFSLAPIVCKNNNINVKINVEAKVKSIIGNVAKVNNLGALPKLQNVQNINDDFLIYLPSSLSFKALNNYLNSQLKTFTVIAEGRNVKLSNFKIGGLNEKEVWLKTDFKSDKIKGSFYLYGKPKINNQTKEVSLTNLKYNVESESWLLKSASYLYNDAILKNLEKNLKYNFSKDLNTVINTTNKKYLNNYQFLGMQVNGNLNTLLVDDYEISENYISIFPLAKGKLSVNVTDLKLKKQL